MNRYTSSHNLFNYEQKIFISTFSLSAPASVPDTTWMFKKYQVNKQVDEKQ